MICQYAASGCNGPRESECMGLCRARTPEEEARLLSADVAEAAEKSRPDYEQRRADRIERRDAMGGFPFYDYLAPRGSL